ncbi:MAG: hypothetical protein COA44_13835 [Arcobacter sp.]|nr:MAG: hypothetical protein COA44_13835 [Arcobacter sp.]
MNKEIEILETITFNKLLLENNENVLQSEKRLISKLSKYTNNKFEDKRWIEIRDNVAKDIVVSFIFCQKKFGNNLTHLAKLFQIIIRLRGNNFKMDHILTFFLFLKDNNLTPRGMTNRSFTQYEEWLNKACTNEDTKQTKYVAALKFQSYLGGHPAVGIIKGIEAYANPFSCSGVEYGRFEVILNEHLHVMDEHFSNTNIELHNRVYYWIQRLYLVRPEDATNTPIDCVKLFSENIVTVKFYVGKQEVATEVVDKTEKNPYKIYFLDLKQKQMKMLYNLILKQQKISIKLQRKANKKGLLLTYEYDNGVVSNQVTNLKKGTWTGSYWSPLMKELFPNTPQKKRPYIKSLKHTGLTKRASQGWSRLYLRDMANHKSFDTIGNYIKGETFMDKKQEEILIAEKRREYGGFKGRVVAWGTHEHMVEKIENDPDAHEMTHGFCPDVDSCGNHFVCIGCEFLIPDMALEEYYYNQAITWVNKSEMQREEGNEIKANDSMTRAGLFHTLFHKTQEMKERKRIADAKK